MRRFMLCSVLSALIVSSVGADEPTAEDYIQYWQPIFGMWEMTTTVGDDVSVAKWTSRLSPTKRCFVTHESSEGLPEFHTIDGYDPELKCWKAVAFDSEGTHRIRLIRCDMSNVKRLSKGATGESEEKSVSVDGTITNTTADFTCLAATKDRIVWLIENRKVNGAPQPDMKVVCERLK
jgi:hypothetical protein